MNFWSLFRALLLRKWLILTVTFVAALTTYLITRAMPDEYKSQAALATGITEGAELSLEEANVSNPFVINTRFSNIMELINSKRVMSLLSYRLILHDLESETPFRSLEGLDEYYDKEFVDKAALLFKVKYDSLESLGTSNELEYELLGILKVMEYDRDALLENLTIERGDGSDFIKISYTSENPYLSAFVTNTLAQEFVRYYKATKSQRVESQLEFFAKLVDKKKEELDTKRSNLKAYKDNNEVINYEAQSSSMLQQISTLESNRELAQQEVLSLRQALRNINNQLSGNSDTDFGAAASRQNQSIQKLKNQIAELNDRYISGGRSDAQLAESINTLRAELNLLIQQSSQANLYQPSITRQDLATRKVDTRIELDKAEARLSSINAELANLRERTFGFSNNEGEISNLESQIMMARDEYLQVLDKFNDARNALLSVANRLEQVEFGEPAYEPEESKKILFVLMAAAGAFSMSVVVILVIEWANQRIESPSRFREQINLPLLGSLNKISLNGFDLKHLFNGTNLDPEREMYKQLLRKIRYEIEQTAPRSLLITSNKEGEGKTFIIVSLAYALSLLGKRVLLIDTNFKNNTLTRLFKPKVNGERLLEEYSGIRNTLREPKLLTEGEPPSEEEAERRERRSLIVPTKLPNVDLIASRGGDLSPSELFSSRNFKQLIEELEMEYDYVFMEGSALNDFSDTKELVGYVDQVLAVYSAESTISYADRQTISYLKQLDGKMLGVVLNKVEPHNLNH